MCVDIHSCHEYSLRLTCSELKHEPGSKLPITFLENKKINHSWYSCLSQQFLVTQFQSQKILQVLSWGCFVWRLCFIFPNPPKGVPNTKKNMTNQYESPSPGIRWSHSPFLRTSISQCLGGHVPGRDGDSPPFKHLLVFMVDSGDGEPPGFLGGLVH